MFTLHPSLCRDYMKIYFYLYDIHSNTLKHLVISGRISFLSVLEILKKLRPLLQKVDFLSMFRGQCLFVLTFDHNYYLYFSNVRHMITGPLISLDCSFSSHLTVYKGPPGLMNNAYNFNPYIKGHCS
jgi:hypothetical protein